MDSKLFPFFLSHSQKLLNLLLLFLFYIVVYIVTKLHLSNALAGIFNTSFQFLINISSGVFSYYCYKRIKEINFYQKKIFITLIIVCFLMAMVNLFWGLEINIKLNAKSSLFINAYRISYLGFLIAWSFFWILVLNHGNRKINGFWMIPTSILLSGLMLWVYYDYYSKLITQDTGSNYKIFVLMYAGLEFFCIVLALFSTSTSRRLFPDIIAFSFAILASTDFVFNVAEYTGTINPNEYAEIPWTLSNLLLFVGIGNYYNAIKPIKGRIKDMYPTDNQYKSSFGTSVTFLHVISILGISSVFLFATDRNIQIPLLIFVLCATTIFINRVTRILSNTLNVNMKQMTIDSRLSGNEKLYLPKFTSWLGIKNYIFRMKDLINDYMENCVPIKGSQLIYSIYDLWSPSKGNKLVTFFPSWHNYYSDLSSCIEQISQEYDLEYDQNATIPSSIDAIFSTIIDGELIILDLTQSNPSIIYALGISHSMGKKTIAIVKGTTGLNLDIIKSNLVYFPEDNIDKISTQLKEIIEREIGVINPNKISIRELTGNRILNKIQEISKLRLKNFRDYPYFYDGNEDYERNYLKGLTRDPDALIITAEEGNEIVAAATSLPLLGPADITKHAKVEKMFKAAKLDPSSFYYYSEILVLPKYRNLGLATTFYSRRRSFAIQRGFTNLCFAAIVHPKRDLPENYYNPEPLWRKMGFIPRKDLQFDYEWPTIRKNGKTEDMFHRMMFWVMEIIEE